MPVDGTRDLDNLGGLRSARLSRVLAALDAEGISVPFNQLDVHVRTVPQA